MSAFQVELLLFTYVPQEESKNFEQNILDWGLRGFSKTGQAPVHGGTSAPVPGGTSAPVPGEEPVSGQAPSKPIDLWDYPYYQEDEVSEQSRITEIARRATEANVMLTKTALKEIKVVYIDSPPAHYSFKFILAFRFTGNLSRSIVSKEELRAYLDTAFEETKTFIKWIFDKAKYRPAYWLFRDLPISLQGLNGTINKIKSPDGGELRIERAFPKFSYLLYDASSIDGDGKPSKPLIADSLSISDLGLLSVVAHLTERGFREDLHRLINKLPETNQQSSENIETRTLSKLSEDMNSLYGKQRALESHMTSYYELRRKLTRTKGLVMRIREKCGGSPDKNIFDIVCDDALTVVEDEITNSLREIENRFTGLSDALNINFNQLNSQRTKKLQTIGHYLQSTAVAGIAYKIFADLMPTISYLKPHLTWQIVLAMLIAVLFGGLTFILLKAKLD